MNAEKLLDILHVAERLKNVTRHCYTSGGRQECVAGHSWRTALMAYLIRDEFPDVDMDKVTVMCLIHDLGEAFTGDIPTFLKTEEDERREEELLAGWVGTFPEPYQSEMLSLYKEMAERVTPEARVFKALDSLEAVIQHNESDISTWAGNEYSLNLTYGNDKVAFSPFLTGLRRAVREETLRKMEEAGEDPAAFLPARASDGQ